MTITRCASAASTPIAAPSSRAHSRMRSSSDAGCRIWLACARRAPELAVDRRADVDPGRGVVAPREVEAADGPRLEPVAGEPRERHRVAGRRVDGVDRRHARQPVVDVVHAAVAVEDRLGVDRQHRVGTELADLADELLAQGEVVGERPVRLVEEADVVVAHDLGRGPLLALAERAELDRVGPPVVRAGVAAGAAHEPADGAFVDPAGGRPGRPEVGVIGVGDDDQEARRGARRDGRAGWRRACALPLDGRTIRRSGGVRELYGQPVSMVLHSRPRLRSSPPTGEVSSHARRPRRTVRRALGRTPGDRRLEGCLDLVGVAVGLDVRPRLRDPPVGVDEEARAADPHVRLAVVRLLAPGAVAPRRRRGPRRTGA